MINLAGCVIRDADNRILLLHRKTAALTQWELPGGKVEMGETPEAAAKREAQEELGVTPQIGGQLGSASFTYDDKEWTYFWFEADIVDEKPAVGEPEKFDELFYWPLKELEERGDLSLNVANLLKSGVPNAPL